VATGFRIDPTTVPPGNAAAIGGSANGPGNRVGG